MTTGKTDGRGDEDGAPALEDDQLFDARRWIDGDVDALTRTETRESSSGASVVIERRAVRREGDDESSAVPYALARARRRRDEDALLVYMHRTGSSKEGVFEHLLRYASEDGWHAVSFDAPGHGERAEADADYATTLSRAYYAMGERDAVRRYGTSPFVIDAAIDCLRVTRAAVRVTGATRVALAGESLGGMVATCAAAAWTPAWGFAVDACAPMIGFSYFQYGLANERWFARAASLPAALWMRVSKGERDAPTLEDARAFYARACPDLCGGSRDGDRALTRVRANKIHFCAVNGSEDARNPLQGVREACARHDAPNKYRDARSQCVVVARKGVGHDITDEMRDVVRGFLRRVRENPTAPEMETFDEREWDVALAAPARPEPESCLAKLKRWAEDEGEDAPGARESELDGDQAAKLLCAYGRTRHQPPGAHAAALANRLVEEAAEGSLHPGAAVLGLWGASLLDMRMSTKQLDILARNAISQDKKLAPRSLAKIVWALAALGYDPTPKDLAALKDRSAHAMPRLMAKDQEALREALARLGDVQITRA